MSQKMRLEGELALDGRGWNRTIEQASHQTEHFVTHQLAHLKGAIVGAFTVGAIETMIHSAIEWGETIKNTSTRLGVSTTAAQEFDFAAKQTGTDLEHVATGMDKLAKALTAIKEGSPEAAKMENAFRRLHLSLDEIAGKSPEEVFRLIGEKMEGMSITAGITTSMLELFGKSGAKLIPMLKDLHENIDKIHDRGLVLTPEMIGQLDEAAKAMQTLGTVSKIIGAGLVLTTEAIGKGFLEVFKIVTGTSTQIEETLDRSANRRIASMEKTLAAQKELSDMLAEHTKRTVADESVRTEEEMHENARTKNALLLETDRIRAKRREKEDDKLPLDEQIKKAQAAMEDLKKAAKQFEPGTLPAADIENQIEKAKDKLDELQKKNRDAALKTLEKENRPHHLHEIKTDSLISAGNFLGESGRNIPAIQERMIDAHKRTTDALHHLASVIQTMSLSGAGSVTEEYV